jgi:hypothetical protein
VGKRFLLVLPRCGFLGWPIMVIWLMDPIGAIYVETSSDGRASYVRAPGPGGQPVVLSGPYACVAEAIKATKTPF